MKLIKLSVASAISASLWSRGHDKQKPRHSPALRLRDEIPHAFAITGQAKLCCQFEIECHAICRE